VGDKISIAEARVRRADPAWRRRHKSADLFGAALVGLLLVVPPLGALLWRPLGMALALALLVGAPAAMWWGGPTVGFERRAAFLTAIPVLNLFVLVPAVWRSAHLRLQHWQGPLQPPWGDTAWLALSVLGVLAWLANLAGLALSLAS